MFRYIFIKGHPSTKPGRSVERSGIIRENLDLTYTIKTKNGLRLFREYEIDLSINHTISSDIPFCFIFWRVFCCSKYDLTLHLIFINSFIIYQIYFTFENTFIFVLSIFDFNTYIIITI